MKGLVVGLGNPILSDDAVGVFVANKLQALYQERHVPGSSSTCNWEFLEFDANPLDLVSYLEDIDRLLIVDAWYPNDGGPVTAVRVDRTAQSAQQQMMATDSHGINVGETLTLAWELEITELSDVWLYLIPIDDPFSLSECLTPETHETAQAMVEYLWATWIHPNPPHSRAPEGQRHA